MNALQRIGYRIKVLAPSDGAFHGQRQVMGVDTFRFSYFRPRRLERLTKRGGGIPENMRNSFLARIQLPFMMGIFFLRSLLESRRADLLYANWLGAGIVGGLVNMINSTPLVVSFRGDDGYLARDRRVWRALTLWVCSRSDEVAPVSKEIADILMELGVDGQKIILPQFGVDTEMFRPRESFNKKQGPVNCLFVGSLIPRKGLHDLLEAMADDSLANMRLTVVGEGAERRNLEIQADRLGLRERVDFRGSLAPENVAELMRESDFFCLPAHMEGRPNVVNEALSSGIPVIATRIGGIPDMIQEGETGFLFEPGDFLQLREDLTTLVNDGRLRREMGLRARRFILESGVSWDNTASEFDRIFKRVCGFTSKGA
jgi:glycosyltransferase involved in cell wall biosynthesis